MSRSSLEQSPGRCVSVRGDEHTCSAWATDHGFCRGCARRGILSVLILSAIDALEPIDHARLRDRFRDSVRYLADLRAEHEPRALRWASMAGERLAERLEWVERENEEARARWRART